MWVFLGRWIRRYLLVAVALPIAGRLLGALGQRAERRTGPNLATRGLRGGGDWLSARSSGPVARRLNRRHDTGA
jgi:hypothetical protein